MALRTYSVLIVLTGALALPEGRLPELLSRATLPLLPLRWLWAFPKVILNELHRKLLCRGHDSSKSTLTDVDLAENDPVGDFLQGSRYQLQLPSEPDTLIRCV